MSRKASTETKEKMVTRTIGCNYSYRIYDFKNGVTELVKDLTLAEKMTPLQERAIRKENPTKNLIFETVSCDEKLMALEMSKFLELAHEVTDETAETATAETADETK